MAPGSVVKREGDNFTKLALGVLFLSKEDVTKASRLWGKLIVGRVVSEEAYPHIRQSLAELCKDNVAWHGLCSLICDVGIEWPSLQRGVPPFILPELVSLFTYNLLVTYLSAFF